MLFARGFAGQFDQFGVAYEPIEDGIGECWILELPVPEFDRQLAGDDHASAPLAIFEQFSLLIFSSAVVVLSLAARTLTRMTALLLLALLCLSLTGFACAAAWSDNEPRHARGRDAAFAFIIGAAAAELVLLGSPLGLMFPWAATLGLVFPLLAGPFWWRSRPGSQRWSWRRWLPQLMPGITLLVFMIAAVAGFDATRWTADKLPSIALTIGASLLNLAAGSPRSPRPRRAAGRRWILR